MARFDHRPFLAFPVLLLTLLAALFLAASSATAGLFDERWELTGFLGSAYNVPSPLWIDQDGHEQLHVQWAEYDTHAFEESPYYLFRLSRWKADTAWELELFHHKIYLVNRPEEVQAFSASHGFNMITVNRAYQYRWFVVRVGGGLIVTHPESEVRGKRFEESGGHLTGGFYFSGLCGHMAVGKTFPVMSFFSLAVEGRVTAGYANMPIVDGDADITHLAAHGMFGVTFSY